MSAGRCFVLTVGVLVLFTFARGYGLLGPLVVAVSLLMAALILIAWSSGATLDDLGLGRSDIGAGLRYGVGAFGVVLLVLLVAAAAPAGRASTAVAWGAWMAAPGEASTAAGG